MKYRAAPKQPSAAGGQPKATQTVPRSEAPKAGRKTQAPSTVAKPPTARPTPNLPEPRKPMGPPAKVTTALKSLLPGAKRFSCVLPRTTYAENKPVAAPKKGNSRMSAGSSLQSTRLPPTRLRPASVSQVSRNPTREPRPTFGKVPGAPSKCASSEVDKL
ncbi:hypothetical protein HPB51_005548 [Rhipicephalus microplus]|uniref:Uncharacterized protein n=1 Tax=Rhipicephalus microplus TaxID=6941 RepID=A0A9J6EXU0_RHIMP|nr:hypothetical protein HPB51_005548 [Rhipicephalus microplus]